MKDFFSSPLPYPYPLSSPGLKVLGCLVNQDPTLSPGGCSLPLLEPSLLSFSDHHFQQFSGAGCLHIWSQNLHCVVVKAEAYCHLTWNKSLKRWALSLPCVGMAHGNCGPCLLLGVMGLDKNWCGLPGPLLESLPQYLCSGAPEVRSPEMWHSFHNGTQGHSTQCPAVILPSLSGEVGWRDCFYLPLQSGSRVQR